MEQGRYLNVLFQKMS